MQDGLRRINVRHDLTEIAKLIELCFGDVLDESGRAAIREMRTMSRAGPFLWLMSLLPIGNPSWQYGFVYVCSGQIVGNIGVQPINSAMDTWLIANVAVHPDYRRQGIARKLVRAALDSVESKSAVRVVLQVDIDNTDAVNLYTQIGFETLAIRTVWRRKGKYLTEQPFFQAPMKIRQALRDDWPLEYSLLNRYSPEGLTWTAPLQIEHLRPSIFRDIGHFMTGNQEERWLILRFGEVVGWIYILSGSTTADQIRWVIDPQWRPALEQELLRYALNRLGDNSCNVWVEHPDGDANRFLDQHFFESTRTLRWMQLDLPYESKK
jgi:GNAT superfamily N-acetyltransferase